MIKAVMAVDVGTSSSRAVVFSYELGELGSCAQPCDMFAPVPGAAEQDPDAIVASVLQVMAGALKASGLPGTAISAVSFSSAMHNLMALDEAMKPLTKLWTWADLRPAAAAQELRQLPSPYARTGCPIHPAYWPAKFRHWQKAYPAIWAKTRHLVGIKEYILYRLSGQLFCDASVAAGTGLLDIFKRQWDQPLIEILGVNPNWLSPVVEPTFAHDGLLPAVAAQVGLPENTKLIWGSSDGTLSSLGVGAVEPDVMALMVGTSAAVRVTVPQPVLHPQEQIWCYYLGQERWVSGGATNNGGNVLKWFLQEIQEGQGDFGQLSALAAQAPAGCDGLLFLPYLAGERCPHWNEDARGVYFGLQLTSTKAHMVRAAMEGVAFQLYSIYQALAEVNGVPRLVRATGGLTHSPIWLQIMADVFGRDLEVPQSAEGSAFGAAAMALVALGVQPNFDFVKNTIPTGQVIESNNSRHGLYKELYQRNRSLYKSLAKEFHLHQRYTAEHTEVNDGNLL